MHAAKLVVCRNEEWIAADAQILEQLITELQAEIKFMINPTTFCNCILICASAAKNLYADKSGLLFDTSFLLKEIS
jgi:hypothetical protein